MYLLHLVVVVVVMLVDSTVWQADWTLSNKGWHSRGRIALLRGAWRWRRRWPSILERGR